MGKIVFICDLEEGHLLPAFGLAHSLKRRGHDISFVNVADNAELIKEQGFTFHMVMDALYPKGFKNNFKRRNLLPPKEKALANERLRKNHIQYVLNGAYSSLIREEKADLYIVMFFLPFDIFILYYKYHILPVIFNPSIRDPEKPLARHCLDFVTDFSAEESYMMIEYLTTLNLNFDSFQQIFEPLNHLPELIACPSELEIELTLTTSNIRYIESSVRKIATPIDVYATYSIPAHKKIIYASMGSQTIRHGASSDLFFEKVIRVMNAAEFRDLHLILCTGPEYDNHKLEAVPDNVTLLNWGPQLDILQVAVAAIIHGGLGGVKECIYYGVPMIILPQAFDQPINAKRVVHHNLGFTDDIHSISEDRLKYYILSAMTDEKIRCSMQKMQHFFHKKEQKEIGATIIEEMLAVKEKSLPA